MRACQNMYSLVLRMTSISACKKWGKPSADLAPHCRGKSPCPLAGAERLQAALRALLGAHWQQGQLVVCQKCRLVQLLCTQIRREDACRQGLCLVQLLLCCQQVTLMKQPAGHVLPFCNWLLQQTAKVHVADQQWSRLCAMLANQVLFNCKPFMYMSLKTRSF